MFQGLSQLGLGVGCGVLLGSLVSSPAQFAISGYNADGRFQFSGTLTNGVCILQHAPTPRGVYVSVKNLFTISTETNLSIAPAAGYYRGQLRDLSPANGGFAQLTYSYGFLRTVAGAGGTPNAGVNKWNQTDESGPAVNAYLSRPHIAMADAEGNIYIADKEAHAIRQVLPDGTIITVAGTNLPGNAPDTPMPGILAPLSNPNGLWVRADGTVYILDLDNEKVRRLEPDGTLSTMFYIVGLRVGRGLWVSDDESVAYICSGTVVKKWTQDLGITDLSSGFLELGNLAVDPAGDLYVTDRSAHLVYRVAPNGSRTIVAGNGNISGGGHGQPATATGLEEVRGIFFLPTGAYFLATHRGSQVWYVDTDGVIHLFLNGHRSDTRAGDNTWFYNPAEFRVSEIRQITVDHQGNLLICENDAGYIRKVEFLPVPED